MLNVFEKVNTLPINKDKNAAAVFFPLVSKTSNS